MLFCIIRCSFWLSPSSLSACSHLPYTKTKKETSLPFASWCLTPFPSQASILKSNWHELSLCLPEASLWLPPPPFHGNHSHHIHHHFPCCQLQGAFAITYLNTQLDLKGWSRPSFQNSPPSVCMAQVPPSPSPASLMVRDGWTSSCSHTLIAPIV